MKRELQLISNQDLTLRDSVFETLRSAIWRGFFEPRERLTETNLADLLGVSRTPVREALQLLEQEQLVVIIPHKGAIVAQMNEDALKDEIEIRRALEELAMVRACENITAQQVAMLADAEKKFEECCQRAEPYECVLADGEFHRRIAEISGNRRLCFMLDENRERACRFRLEILKDPSQYPRLIDEHKDMVEALRARDPEKGTAAIRKHFTRQQNALLHYMKSA